MHVVLEKMGMGLPVDFQGCDYLCQLLKFREASFLDFDLIELRVCLDEAYKQLTCAILDVHRRFLALSFPDPRISVGLTNCFDIFCTVLVQIHSDTKILINKHPCDEI